jgi:ABC-type sugar transport system ATPase subunit
MESSGEEGVKDLLQLPLFTSSRLLSAVVRFYKADQMANQNAKLLLSSGITSKEASEIMQELEAAKQHLFEIARVKYVV